MLILRSIYLLLCLTFFGIAGFTDFELQEAGIAPTTVIEKQELLFGKVIAITDGDTFKLFTKDSVTHRIRLASIDCPERKQAFSQRAKEFASDAIFSKEVKVKIDGKDRYGRYIGWVYYDNSKILNEELIKHGLAWHYRKYSKDENLQKMEDKAREQKLGLWADKAPIPPWDWRN